MTWKQIRSLSEKRGLSCKDVYELILSQNTPSNKFSDTVDIALEFLRYHTQGSFEIHSVQDFINWVQEQQTN